MSIGNNTQMMLKLQTITENLGTIVKVEHGSGHVSEDIDAVIGQMSALRGMTFRRSVAGATIIQLEYHR